MIINNYEGWKWIHPEKRGKTMMNANEWNKKENRNLKNAIQEFGLDFLLETGRGTLELFEDAGDYLANCEDEDNEPEIFSDCEIEAGEIPDCVVICPNFYHDKLAREISYDRLAEIVEIVTPEVEFKKWLKKNGYCLD